MSNQVDEAMDPTHPADGTRDGDGVWQGGRWYPDVVGSSGGGLPENPMWRTHHAPGSPEERYSRQMRFDKYLAMQQLLGEIAVAQGNTEVGESNFNERARAILAGMVRPRGPSQRAQDRATELEVLVAAYKLACGVNPVVSNYIGEARALIVEALKAWERSHPPAAIDPLLGP